MELLKEVLSVQTNSGQTKRMRKYIRAYLKSRGLKYETDNLGNTIVHKGDKSIKRPFVVSHIDTVHKVNGNVTVHNINDFFIAIDELTMTQAGVGGDDKVGVWACLELLNDPEVENVSCAFFVDEEIGCIGSGAVSLSHFENATWIGQLDRKGNKDFITHRIASEEFEKATKSIIKKHGYKFLKNYSTITDSAELSSRGVGVSCFNMSCGYYSPHSDSEVVNIEDAIDAYELIKELVLSVTSTYSNTYKGYSYSGYQGSWQRGYGYGGAYGRDFNDNYDTMTGHDRGFNNALRRCDWCLEWKPSIEIEWKGGMKTCTSCKETYAGSDPEDEVSVDEQWDELLRKGMEEADMDGISVLPDEQKALPDRRTTGCDNCHSDSCFNCPFDLYT